eukprot:CAMPEP_0174273546 /NCGR_PEP_ID=MMETSP0439-20130205/54877_1 /TAXON_ID=0 /ORGANISM="Stereomyxa ramosa, Strain Chinc5" /LENGTH=1184 /DNA_ID=CAMNT_0015364759 /DNA_START=1 /DNA_END=3555 /DNA_ORIENTATION=-
MGVCSVISCIGYFAFFANQPYVSKEEAQKIEDTAKFMLEAKTVELEKQMEEKIKLLNVECESEKSSVAQEFQEKLAQIKREKSNCQNNEAETRQKLEALSKDVESHLRLLEQSETASEEKEMAQKAQIEKLKGDLEQERALRESSLALANTLEAELEHIKTEINSKVDTLEKTQYLEKKIRELEETIAKVDGEEEQCDASESLQSLKLVASLEEKVRELEGQFESNPTNDECVNPQELENLQRKIKFLEELEPPTDQCEATPKRVTKAEGTRKKNQIDMESLRKASESGTPVLHVVSHTHWDREWYLGFETFRGRLVALLDMVFDKFHTDSNFKHFHLDGQMVPVDDYLQVREHMREELVQANIDGKLALGPWYVQPDEYLVSAEALVRNLQLGIMKANEMGGSSLLGYIPDSFGHIGQMPQMLKGFDINSAISGRGPPNSYKSEFWWEGVDGSRVLFFFLKSWYCNALEMSPTWAYFDRKNTELSRTSATKHVLLLNGCDHTRPTPEIGSVVARLNDQAQNKIILHSNMDDYVELVSDEIERKGINLQSYSGELREQVDGLANTLSTMLSQKKKNWMLQIWLEKWVEPLETIAWMGNGRTYDHDTIWFAWKTLLENHPHDSICGCSSEEVHHDVNMRFTKCKQIVRSLASNSAISVARFITKQTKSSGDTSIAIINPTNIPLQKEVVVVQVFFSRKSTGLTVTDSNGKEVPSAILADLGNTWTFNLPDVGFRKTVGNMASMLIGIEVDIPSFGYGVYTLNFASSTAYKTSKGRAADFHGIEQIRKRRAVRHLLGVGEKVIENEHLRVTLNEEKGTVDVLHKASSQVFAGLNDLEAQNDNGDEYKTSPSGGASYSSNGRNWKVVHSNVHSMFTGQVTVGSGSKQLDCDITYVLKKGSRRVDVQVKFQNKNNKYRIRSIHRVSGAGRQSFADSQFDLYSRQNGRYSPQQKFVSLLVGSKNGLTIANKGLPEYTYSSGTLAITLLRATDRIGDWGTFPVRTGADYGTHKAEFSIIPFASSSLSPLGGSDLEARKFNEEARGFQLHRVESTFYPEVLVDLTYSEIDAFSQYSGSGTLNSNERTELIESTGDMSQYSWVDVRPMKIVLSSVKKCEFRNSMIVRVYNPFSEGVKDAEIYVNKVLKVKQAYEVQLNEKRVRPVDLDILEVGRRVKVDIPAKKVVTLEFTL